MKVFHLRSVAGSSVSARTIPVALSGFENFSSRDCRSANLRKRRPCARASRTSMTPRWMTSAAFLGRTTSLYLSISWPRVS